MITLPHRPPGTALRSRSLRGGSARTILLLFLLVAGGHFAEHVVQLFQHLVLDWPARRSGGVLGLAFPGLAASEVLHSGWNTLQLCGLMLLWPLLRGRGAISRLWLAAIAAQSWHWFEHVLLQVQVLTGHYLFMAVKQQSLLELLFPRIELHFVYNLLSFAPSAVAIVLLLRGERGRNETR